MGLLVVLLVVECAQCLAANGIPAAVPAPAQGAATGICYSHMDGLPRPGVVPARPDTVAPQAGSKVVLPGVPAWTWCYGCANTAAAMIFGYYDRNGYPNMYKGKATDVGAASAVYPADAHLCPMNNELAWPDSLPNLGDGESPLAASHQGIDGRVTYGHVDDWYYAAKSAYDPCTDAAEPWTPHSPPDCLGDFMYTSMAIHGCHDGDTLFFWDPSGRPARDYSFNEPDYRDGMHGMKLFAQSRGYTVTEVFTQLILPTPKDKYNVIGFDFDDYKAEIDAGRPVMLLCGNHVFVGYGYNTSGGAQTCYVRTTWDTKSDESNYVPWGGSLDGEEMWAVGVLRLDPPPTVIQPDMAIRGQSSAGYVGEEQYSGDGQVQAATTPVMPSATTVFTLKITNQGTVADTYKITGTGSNVYWTVNYFSAETGGTNVSTDVTKTGDGWSTGTIAAGASRTFRVEVRARSDAPANDTYALSITATSVANPAKFDTVQATTTRLSADVNGDGSIDEKDAAAFFAGWRTVSGGGAVDPRFDLDGDGDIDHLDAGRYVDLLLLNK